MRIASLLRWERVIVLMLSTPLLSFLLDAQAFAGDDTYRVTRVDWWIVLDEVIVSYDLDGSVDETYKVQLVLRRDGDISFSYVPTAVVGNVGEGKYAGRNNQIRWLYKKDAPQGFVGDDYYFDVVADRPGGFPWLYVAGAGAVGGVLVALLGGKKTDEVIPPPPTKLPFPPPRP